MKKDKLHLILAISIINLTLISCDKNNIENDVSKSVIPKEVESEFFSVNYSYSDTISIYDDNNRLVKVVISSDKEETLKSHLAKTEYFLDNVNANDDRIDYQNIKKNTTSENQELKFENFDITNIPKIRIEIIDVNDGIQRFDLKRKKTKNQTTDIQKVPFNPTPWYYEETSPAGSCYGKIRVTNIGDGGLDIPASRVRYGYRSCWLFCAWKTWPQGEYLVLDNFTQGYLFSVNSFGKDGFNYTGYSIYQLCTGILTYSPYNFVNHWSKDTPPVDWYY